MKKSVLHKIAMIVAVISVGAAAVALFMLERQPATPLLEGFSHLR
jgi:hypothetical protein